VRCIAFKPSRKYARRFDDSRTVNNREQPITLAKTGLSKDRRVQVDENSTTPQGSCIIIIPQTLIRCEMNRCEIVEVSGVELDRALKKGL
jgi:hypothetical protein